MNIISAYNGHTHTIIIIIKNVNILGEREKRLLLEESSSYLLLLSYIIKYKIDNN